MREDRIHDEYERAYTGRARRGLSPLAWLAIVFFGSLLVGAVALGWIGYMVVREVGETVRMVESGVIERFESGPEAAVAELLVGLHPDLELVSNDPTARTLTVRNRVDDDVSEVSYQDVIEGHLRIRTPDGDVSVRLNGDETGGSLSIVTEEGEVVSVEVAGGDDGGSMVVRTRDGEVFALEAGAGAHDPPDWVPFIPRASEPIAFLSGSLREGDGGAVRLESELSPASVAAWYIDHLEDRGYEIRSERFEAQGDRGRLEQTSVIGTHERLDRTVAVVAVDEDGLTKILLSWANRAIHF